MKQKLKKTLFWLILVVPSLTGCRDGKTADDFPDILATRSERIRGFFLGWTGLQVIEDSLEVSLKLIDSALKFGYFHT